MEDLNEPCCMLEGPYCGRLGGAMWVTWRSHVVGSLEGLCCECWRAMLWEAWRAHVVGGLEEPFCWRPEGCYGSLEAMWETGGAMLWGGMKEILTV